MLPQSVSTKYGLQTGYKMQTRYKMQTADWVQNADREQRLFSVWYVTSCHLKTYRVTQSVFRGHPSPTLAVCGIFLARCFMYFVFNKAARPQVIYLLHTWFASWLVDLRKAAFLASECEDSGRPTFNDAHVLCHLSSISYCVLLFLNIDMTARAQSLKIWVDYEGLKFYVRKIVAWPIGGRSLW